MHQRTTDRPLLSLLICALATASVAKAQTLRWPLAEPLHDRSYVSNYLDLNPASGFRDYECGLDHGYDGHTGMDLAVHDFRLADQGVAILAAADGRIESVRFDQFDRNMATPYQGSGNGVWLRHDDGRYSLYWHMRRNSPVLAVGERVRAGQLLGYVASSGSSPIPHLHFQLNRSLQLNDRLPLLAGRCGETPTSVFESQPEYVGNARLRVLAMGVHSNLQLGQGMYQFGAIEQIKQGLIEPAQLADSDERIAVYVQLQGNPGQQLRITLRDPDGSIKAQHQTTLSSKRRYGWYLARMAVTVPLAHGRWQMEVADASGTLQTRSFAVGAQTVQPPRFYPLAGRSIRLDGSTQRVPLQRAHRGDQLRLVGAPAGVALVDEQLVIPADLRAARRSSHFAVIDRDSSSGLQDVFHVHLVDPLAPYSTPDFSKDAGGWYYAPEQSGQGLAIEVNAALGLVFLGWYAYDFPAGDGERRQWLTASGPYAGSFANLDTTLTYGGVFDREDSVTHSRPGSIGRIRLQRESCQRINVIYEWGPGRSGFIAMQRLLPQQCEAAPSR